MPLLFTVHSVLKKKKKEREEAGTGRNETVTLQASGSLLPNVQLSKEGNSCVPHIAVVEGKGAFAKATLSLISSLAA